MNNWYINSSKVMRIYIYFLCFLQGDRDQLETLTSLVPGEVLQFQIRINVIKYGLDETRGHWSHWSKPVAAMVPQSAGVSGRRK